MKAILVMDKMPDNCAVCKIVDPEVALTDAVCPWLAHKSDDCYINTESRREDCPIILAEYVEQKAEK